MLTKLMKYEWRFIWKKMLLINLAGMVASFLSTICFDIMLRADSSNVNPVVIILATIGYMMFYSVMSVAAFGLLLIIGIRFYQSVYGREGYLTHTLPATPRELHLSKLIVNSFAAMLTSCVLMVSMLLSFRHMFLGIFEPVELPFSVLMKQTGVGTLGWVLFLIAGLLIGGICNVTCLYASVVLGQYWKRAKVFGAIVWYVIITTVMGFGALLLFLPKMIQMILNEMNPPADFFSYLFGVTIGVTAVVAIITYLITEHGISKKLNLQ